MSNHMIKNVFLTSNGTFRGNVHKTPNGRTDTIYGDIHFYLPPGTRFYAAVSDAASPDTNNLNAVHTSAEPLFVSMTFEKGDCSMITRRQNANTEARFGVVGEPLINTDTSPTDNTIADTSLKYEYNLYRTARRLYPQNPSAGFELLRFGRVISTGHETLTPANAPLWRTVSFPGGTGMVNLASSDIKKFSDADFPHWTGWRMVDGGWWTMTRTTTASVTPPLSLNCRKAGISAT